MRIAEFAGCLVILAGVASPVLSEAGRPAGNETQRLLEESGSSPWRKVNALAIKWGDNKLKGAIQAIKADPKYMAAFEQAARSSATRDAFVSQAKALAGTAKNPAAVKPAVDLLSSSGMLSSVWVILGNHPEAATVRSSGRTASAGAASDIRLSGAAAAVLPATDGTVREGAKDSPPADGASGAGAPAEPPSGCPFAAIRDLLKKQEPASLAQAEAKLKECSSKEGEAHQLMGVAQFLQQKYDAAKESLSLAVAANPQNAEWSALLERASRNVTSQIALGNTNDEKFDNAALAQPAATYIREPKDIKPLPAAPPEHPLIEVPEFLGGIGTKILHRVVEKADKKGPVENWKEWPKLKDGDIRAALMLASIRKYMNKFVLQDTTEPGKLYGNQQRGQVRPEWTKRFRTANGMWTTDDPAEGAAGTRVQWQGATAIGQIRKDRSGDTTLPSSREVSRAFLVSNGERARAPFLNQITIWWIQFMLHGWVNHRNTPLAERAPFRVKLAEDDPFRSRYNIEELLIPVSQRDATTNQLAYQNEVVAWWGGGQIYGNDQATQDKLRTNGSAEFLPDGKMHLPNGLLPIDERGRELSGFTRNWNVGLSMLHAIFVKHHNKICDVLKAKHPDWSTDQLFHTARLINAAVMAKIHTVEWTPAVLPTKTLTTGMNTNWNGLIETMTKRFKDRKALRGAAFGDDPVLGGLMGAKRNNYGVPHNFSEHFAEVYRLHHGVPDDLSYQPVGSAKVEQEIPIDALRERGGRAMIEQAGVANLLNSFGMQKMHALVENNYPKFFSDMSVEGNAVIDLGTIDIHRARERGVPPYNLFRRELGLPAIASFEELGVKGETLAKLKRLYGEDGVEKMDLLVGTSCEKIRPLMGFGQTMFAIFVQMASRRLEADPFYTDKFNEQYYTKEGIELIDRANFKDILLELYPELGKTGLTGINNAFEPWSSTPASAPAEHPLSNGAEKY